MDMIGFKRQAPPSGEQSASAEQLASASRDVQRHVDSQTGMERKLRKGGVVFDFVAKAASAGYWVVRLLRVFDLL